MKDICEFEELGKKREESAKLDELFRVFMRWFKESEYSSLRSVHSMFKGGK